MGISAEATEAVSVTLMTELRRCLALGVEMKGPFIKSLLAQLESFSVNDVSGARTDVLPDNPVDGRNTAEAAVIV